MRLYQFIIIALLSIVYYNCTKEEDFIVEEVPYKRVSMYDTNSSNKVLKFESQYYYKYDRFFITNPDSLDYLYNFSSKNEEIEFTYPKQDIEHLWKGVEMIKELLLDAYPDKFIHDHFPYSIMLADGKMYDPAHMDEEALYLMGRYFCIFSIQDISQMSFEEKAAVSVKLHETIWRYIGLCDRGIELPDEFYSYGDRENLYGQFLMDEKYEKYFDPDALYEIGFPNLFRFLDVIPVIPNRGEDVGYWMSFLIETPDDEIQALLDKYEAMQIKYTHLMRLFEKWNIDYKKLRYKE